MEEELSWKHDDMGSYSQRGKEFFEEWEQ